MRLPQDNMCVGCGACVEACGKNALTLGNDNCGFVHPVLNSALCCDCKSCENVCPLINSSEKNLVKKVFAVRAVDSFLEENSSSGGAFSVLAQRVLSLGGVVYGAGYDERFNVCHKRVTEAEDLKYIRGSKYVQSDFLVGAKEALADLKEGKTVLFCGTPCQVAALKNMSLNIKKAKLYTIDFICHGVASPLLFEKYRDFVSNGKEIKNISFRDKTESWQLFSMKVDFSDSTSYRKNVTQDPYLLAFVCNVSIRSSCNNCSFTGVDRISDITLGDAWTQKPQNQELCNGKGVSLVLVNTEQGNTLFEDVKDNLISEELPNDTLDNIKPLHIPTKVNPLKGKYYRDMKKLEFDKLTAKYCGSSVDAKIRRFIAKKTFIWRQSFE